MENLVIHFLAKTTWLGKKKKIRTHYTKPMNDNTGTNLVRQLKETQVQYTYT